MGRLTNMINDISKLYKRVGALEEAAGIQPKPRAKKQESAPAPELEDHDPTKEKESLGPIELASQVAKEMEPKLAPETAIKGMEALEKMESKVDKLYENGKTPTREMLEKAEKQDSSPEKPAPKKKRANKGE